MRRLAAAALLLLALGAGTPSAAVFAVVPEIPAAPAGPLVLPSAEVPNEPGMLLPPGAFDAPFLPVRELAQAELQALWRRAGEAYGIPWQVLAAINEIESNFGRNMGPSSAGAVGWMQFMPDTWLRWGMDGNGDGNADPWNAEDGVYSAARYLAATGGRTDIASALLSYNRAQWYVDDVLALAAVFGGGSGGADAVFSLDRLALAVEEAQQRVSALGEALAAAEEREAQLAARADELARPADDLALLLSDRIAAEKDAFQASQERAAAAAEVARLRGELEQAQAALAAAQSGARSESFAPAAADVLRMPSRADGYVFPVGGGPGVVSVGSDHNGYPAADIAAPMGTPLYALAEAVVTAVVDDARCGIGLNLQTLDGLRWVYCHMSYRDPALQAGSRLGAGQWVGLVGSTGRSTGPHLHLGLQPARYPQEMPWFREFAGVAFTWQDRGPQPAARTSPVFALVPAAAKPDDAVVQFTLRRD